MKFIDSHTHLFAKEFDEDRDAVIQRALDAAVCEMYLPNIDMDTVPAMMAMVEKWSEHCFPMIGLHPCSVKADFEAQLKQLYAYLQKDTFIAVGEIGLDFYWDTTFKEQQVIAFERQIDWALAKDLPIVIHTRNAIAEGIDIVRKKQNGNLKGVFHCFGGMVEEALRIRDLDFYLGFGGVTTFKNGGLEAVLKAVPLEGMLLETDAPYLAPAPHRGKRNESAYIPLIAQKIADIKEISLAEVAEQTTKNSLNLFKKNRP